MDKFIVKKNAASDGWKSLVIDIQTHEKLMQIKEVTGVPIGRLIAQMVDFCAERLHVDE